MFSLLKENDKVALISPASFITKDKLKLAIQNLENLKLTPFFLDSVLDRHGYFAGTDQERANELHKMYEDKSVKAILCVRGGYGTARILKLLDYKLIKSNPKPLIGYSDITALLLSIYKNTGQIGFHGVVGASKFSKFTEDNFREMFFIKQEVVKMKLFQSADIEQYTIFPGKVKGKLIGGNLTILTSLLSTPFDVDWKNKIVFIEEINEPPYKIDRMLTQLIQAGKFKNVKGIIFGQFNKCEPKDFEIKKEDTFNIKEILFDLIRPLKIPSAYGFTFGHIENQIILPIGATANFNSTTFEIRVNVDFLR